MEESISRKTKVKAVMRSLICGLLMPGSPTRVRVSETR